MNQPTHMPTTPDGAKVEKLEDDLFRVKGVRNELQRENTLLKARIEVAKDKLHGSMDMEQNITDAEEILDGECDEYVTFMLCEMFKDQEESGE